MADFTTPENIFTNTVQTSMSTHKSALVHWVMQIVVI